MRFFLTILLCGLTSTVRAEWTLAWRREVTALPGGAKFVEREARQDGRAVRVQGVFFFVKQARFAVVDNAAGATLGATMAATGALAGTNGAYFHPDSAPVGLVIAAGSPVHPFERARLLSGVFVVTKGRPRIVRSAKFTPSAADTDALQAGPFLVENGRPVAGLNAVRVAPRTVVATDGAGRWALLLLSPVTLADAAAVLAARAAGADFPVGQALNLDGGSSSGLWVAMEPQPFYRREFATVRNFLAIRPR